MRFFGNGSTHSISVEVVLPTGNGATISIGTGTTFRSKDAGTQPMLAISSDRNYTGTPSSQWFTIPAFCIARTLAPPQAGEESDQV